MVHFNQRQGLFQSKKDILQYVNDDPREYIPYDYSYSEDIFPAINNLSLMLKSLKSNVRLKIYACFWKEALSVFVSKALISTILTASVL